MKYRACPICGKYQPADLDHAVPTWVSTALPGDGAFTIEQGDEEGPHRTYTTKNRAEAKVYICVACHRHLNKVSEHWASGQLRGLISSGRSRTFSDDEFRRIAHWCVRTAIIVDLTQVQPAYPDDVRGYLATGDAVPHRTFVWAGR